MGWFRGLAPGSLSRSSHRPPYAEESFTKLMIKKPALQQTQGKWWLLVTGAAAGRDTERERGLGEASGKPVCHPLGGLVWRADPLAAQSRAKHKPHKPWREGAREGRALKLAFPVVVRAHILREVVSTPGLVNSFW